MVFQVTIDSDRVVPGDRISGKVFLDYHEEKNIRGIIIECYGKEKTRWKEGKTHVSDENLLYHKDIRPIGPGKLIGQRTIPFSFHLNEDLPATFHGQHYGYIKYKVRAKVDIVMGIDDEEIIEVIVLSKIDLNRKFSELNKTTHFTETKEITDWGCAGDTAIALDLKLRKQAFALGELIEMIMVCENTSDVAISNFDVELIFTTIYQVRGTCSGEYHTRKEKEIISTKRGNGVGPRETKNYDFSLGVPTNFGLPNFSACELFISKCKLKITGVTDGLHFNLKLKAPIVLGHVPFRGSRRNSPNFSPSHMPALGATAPVPFVPVPMPMPMPMPMPHGTDSFGLSPFAPFPPSAPLVDISPQAPPYPGNSTVPANESAPPPSYEEAMSSNHN